jgi:hypothetical protein
VLLESDMPTSPVLLSWLAWRFSDAAPAASRLLAGCSRSVAAASRFKAVSQVPAGHYPQGAKTLLAACRAGAQPGRGPPDQISDCSRFSGRRRSASVRRLR